MIQMIKSTLLLVKLSGIYLTYALTQNACIYY